MSTLTLLLLAEIDQRAEWARTTQMGVDPLAIDTLAYLTALRNIVKLHDGPHQCWDSERIVTIMDDDCETQLIIASALGVEAWAH